MVQKGLLFWKSDINPDLKMTHNVCFLFLVDYSHVTLDSVLSKETKPGSIMAVRLCPQRKSMFDSRMHELMNE